MIIKNCLIYDEKDDKEKIVDIIFDDTINEYKENLSSAYPTYTKITVRLTDLTLPKIKQINEKPDKFILDAEGMITIPGGIDAHVHFDTPGFTHREDFYHGSMSAAAGGVTTVIDMPCTSLPPVTNAENFDVKMDIIKDMSLVDYALFGGIYANDFENYENSMEALKDKGVKGYKTYFTSGMESYPKVTKYQFFKIMRKAKGLRLPVLLHAEDNELLYCLQNDYRNEKDDYMRYYNSRPALAEVLAVSDAVEIAKTTKGSLHIVHVASGLAAQIINNALHNFDITYETCPHYLYFTYKDFETKGSTLKTAPVVKNHFDQDLLWKYLIDGNCSFVASDHAPATFKEKTTGSFWKDYSGIPGTQTLIPVVFSEGYSKGDLSLKRFIEITSANPAKRYNLYPKKGTLQKGADADITIIDKNKKWKFETKQLYSKGETSPFDGENFEGKIMLTILRGKIIYHEGSGITSERGYGKYV